MGIKFKQIDNLQSTFNTLSGNFQGQISGNTSDISGVYNDSQLLSGWKYFANNVDISGQQGLLVQNDNVYTPNNLIAGGAKIGFPINSPRNSTPVPLGVMQVTGGQIYFEDQLNVRNDSDIVITNGNITANGAIFNSVTGDSINGDYITGLTGNFSSLTGGDLNYNSGTFDNSLTISGQIVATGEIKEYSANSGVDLIDDVFVTSRTGSFDAIGIGTANPQSILDINSIESAPIMPRMTTVQMNAITSPIEGMLIYNTDSGKFAGYTGAWSLLH